MTAILKPGNGKEKKVVTDLMRIFCDPSQMGMYGTKEELEDTEDFYPFCYIPINIVWFGFIWLYIKKLNIKK